MAPCSQVSQDLFVLHCLAGKKNGTWLEIGANDPINLSNTYRLEKEYGWRGVSVEIDGSFLPKYLELRPLMAPVIADATMVDYPSELQKAGLPADIDFLQIDLEVTNRSTLSCLEALLAQGVFGRHRFATVCFEHDIYRGDFFETRAVSRKIFSSLGYFRAFSDVANGKDFPFEDWYVHPALVNPAGLAGNTGVIDYRDAIASIEAAIARGAGPSPAP